MPKPVHDPPTATETHRRPDRRVARTRRVLRQALLELSQETDYARITVQNVLDRADIGRSTFYSHFRSKDDLLLGDLSFIKQYFEDRGPDLVPPMQGLFEHVEEFSPILKALTAGGARKVIFDRLRNELAILWEERIQRLVKDQDLELPQDVPILAAAQVSTSTFLTLLAWWLDNGRVPPPRAIDSMIRRIVATGLTNHPEKKTDKKVTN